MSATSNADDDDDRSRHAATDTTAGIRIRRNGHVASQAGFRSHSPLGQGQRYASSIFDYRLREAGLIGSMGGVISSVDNTMVE